MNWKSIIWPSSKESKARMKQQKLSLIARILKAAPVILGAILLTFFLSRTGVFRQLESEALDTQMRLQSTQEDSEVVIIEIDDQDYANLFQSKSPLDHKNLTRLIDALALGKPRVIGVDIDTAAAEFRDVQPGTNWPAVVWARNGTFSNRDEKYHVTNVLGGRNPPPPSGLAVMRLSNDNAVRRYTRICDTNIGLIPSFTWAVVKEFSPDITNHLEANSQELFIRFTGTREASHWQRLSASRVLELSDGAGWQNDGPIKDKIVLLGGAYSAADEHDTPVGWLLGVEVLAYTIETELNGGGLRPAGRLLVTSLGGFVALAILLLYQHFPPSRALLLSVICIPVLAMAASLVAFRSLAFWAYFVPVPLAVLIQELYGQAKDYRKKLLKQLYEGVVGRTTESIAAVRSKREASNVGQPDAATETEEHSESEPEVAEVGVKAK